MENNDESKLSWFWSAYWKVLIWSALLCVQWWNESYTYCTLPHTHHLPISRTPGKQKEKAQIQSVHLMVCLRLKGKHLCESLHSTPCQGPLLSKQPYKYFYLKDHQQPVWLQLRSSLDAAAAQWLLDPRAKSSRIPSEANWGWHASAQALLNISITAKHHTEGLIYRSPHVCHRHQRGHADKYEQTARFLNLQDW